MLPSEQNRITDRCEVDDSHRVRRSTPARLLQPAREFHSFGSMAERNIIVKMIGSSRVSPQTPTKALGRLHKLRVN
jgi:hypothetical protein